MRVSGEREKREQERERRKFLARSSQQVALLLPGMAPPSTISTHKTLNITLATTTAAAADAAATTTSAALPPKSDI